MAIALIASPTSPDGAYRKGAGVFNYKNELSVTGTADSSGDLQLTITGIGALVEVGDYLYYDQLAKCPPLDIACKNQAKCDANEAMHAWSTEWLLGVGDAVSTLGGELFKCELQK